MQYHYHISTFFPESNIRDVLLDIAACSEPGEGVKVRFGTDKWLDFPFSSPTGEREIEINHHNGAFEIAQPPPGIRAADLRFKTNLILPYSIIADRRRSLLLEGFRRSTGFRFEEVEIMVNLRALNSPWTEIWFVANGSAMSDALSETKRFRALFVRLLRRHNGILGILNMLDRGEKAFWFQGRILNRALITNHRNFDELTRLLAQ